MDYDVLWAPPPIGDSVYIKEFYRFGKIILDYYKNKACNFKISILKRLSTLRSHRLEV